MSPFGLIHKVSRVCSSTGIDLSTQLTFTFQGPKYWFPYRFNTFALLRRRQPLCKRAQQLDLYCPQRDLCSEVYYGWHGHGLWDPITLASNLVFFLFFIDDSFTNWMEFWSLTNSSSSIYQALKTYTCSRSFHSCNLYYCVDNSYLQVSLHHYSGTSIGLGLKCTGAHRHWKSTDKHWTLPSSQQM